jgi:hypothetical protein
MTETQGDFLGCAIVILSLAPLLRAVTLAERGQLHKARWLTLVSMAMSLTGVFVVIVT